MTSASLSPAKKELVDSIAQLEGYNDYIINVKTGSMKGDGYMGIINTVQIVDKQSKKPDLNLIIKSAQPSDNLREVAPVRKAYEREIFMYTTVFSELENIQKANNVSNPFKETPRLYGHLLTEKEESLILENLKENDFKLWNRQKPMDENHVALVFSTYGKFHGASLALKNLNPEKYAQLEKNLKNIFESESEESMEKLKESFKVVYENGFRAVKNNPAGTQGMTRFLEGGTEFFEKTLKIVDKFTTILHGDCWCNNMMFKYTDPQNPSKPTDMRLIDFQISHTGSPIIDLSYYLYASGSKEVLYKLDDFLAIYLDSLSRILRESGLNADDIITMDELKEQWKIYSKYGLFMTFFVMKVVLSSSEEAPDLSALADTGKNMVEMISNADSSNMEEINKRIADVIIFMVDRNFL